MGLADAFARLADYVRNHVGGRPRFVCGDCRLVDDVGEFCYCAYPCGRCGHPTAGSFALTNTGMSCPICRETHMDACSVAAIGALLNEKRRRR